MLPGAIAILAPLQSAFILPGSIGGFLQGQLVVY